MSQRIALTIIMDENGAVSLNGSIQDKVLCYGLLGCAYDAIQDWHKDQQPGPKLVAPTGADIMAIGNGRGS